MEELQVSHDARLSSMQNEHSSGHASRHAELHNEMDELQKSYEARLSSLQNEHASSHASVLPKLQKQKDELQESYDAQLALMQNDLARVLRDRDVTTTKLQEVHNEFSEVQALMDAALMVAVEHAGALQHPLGMEREAGDHNACIAKLVSELVKVRSECRVTVASCDARTAVQRTLHRITDELWAAECADKNASNGVLRSELVAITEHRDLVVSELDRVRAECEETLSSCQLGTPLELQEDADLKWSHAHSMPADSNLVMKQEESARGRVRAHTESALGEESACGREHAETDSALWCTASQSEGGPKTQRAMAVSQLREKLSSEFRNTEEAEATGTRRERARSKDSLHKWVEQYGQQ